MDALNARGNALDQAIPVIPISLVFDRDSYDNIRVTEGIHGAMCLYLNNSGYLYLGFATDMSAHMTWYNQDESREEPTEEMAGKRGFWQAEKARVAQFQCMSGRDAVRRLQSLYSEKRPESLYLFRKIVSLSMQAHDRGVANEGHQATSDVDAGFEATRDTGARLQELQHIVAAWDTPKQTALQGFREALQQGVFAATRFTFQDDQWISLSPQEKEIVVDLCELEEEAGTDEDARSED